MTSPTRRIGITIAALLLPGLLLLVVWSGRLATLAPLSWGVDDPAWRGDGFYPAEAGEGGVRFRWSRPAAGVLVPALAARQTVTLEMTAPRPDGVAAPTGVRLEANGSTVPLTFAPGWATYTITAPSQIGLENAVALVAGTYDDSFVPGAGDSRRLTAAVRRVTVAPAPDVGGWPLPAPLPGVGLLLLPALAWALARRWREGWALGIAAGVAVVAGIGIAMLPAPFLPTALLVVGVILLLGGAVAYAGVWTWLEGGLARRWSPAFEVLGLIVVFGGLAVAATWPLATQWTTALPGWPGDNYAFLYKIWWVETALRTGANLFNDPNVFAPFGFNFGRGEPTLPNTIPGALVALGAGPVAGYNAVLLAGFVLSGLGTYGLARTVGANRPAALLAGIVFMLAPYRLAQAAGHLQIAATQWLPCTLLFAERTLRRPRWRDATLLGLCYGLTVLTAWYYALIGGLLLGGYVVLRGWTLRRGFPWVAAGRAAVVAGLVAGVVVLPGLLPALEAAGEAPLRHSAKAADENSASPEDYLIPNQLHPLWGRPAMEAHAQQNIIEDALYPGLIAAVLAGIALLARRRIGQPGIWVILGAICFVLSLGLTLHTAGGGQALIGGGTVTLPGRLFYDWVPGFSSLRAYARFGVGVALGGAVLAGLGATWLLARPVMLKWRAAGAVGLIALVLCDLWSAPNAWGLTTVQPNAVAGWLAAQPPGAVIQLPLTSAVAGPPLYAGTFYAHPLAFGYETFEPPGFVAARPTLAGFPSTAAFTLLRGWGVRYVVVAASSYGAQWAGTRPYFATLPDWTEAYHASQPPTWAAPFWVGDVRPELRDLLAPDELVVYRLK